jgi:hypothetical protein
MGTAFSRFRVKPALLLAAHLQNAHPTALQTSEFGRSDRNLRLAKPDAPAQEILPTAIKA